MAAAGASRRKTAATTTTMAAADTVAAGEVGTTVEAGAGEVEEVRASLAASEKSVKVLTLEVKRLRKENAELME